MKYDRDQTIDYLRGCAVILMTFIHVAAYYLSNRTVYFIWDYAHFVVPLFLFCSAYVTFSKPYTPLRLGQVVARLKRLIIPFWIYLSILTACNIVVNNKVTVQSFFASAFLLNFGSRDFDWMVTLFVMMIFVIHFVHYCGSKRHLIVMAALISGASTVLLMFYRNIIPYRLVMWLPYMFFVCVVYFINRFKNRQFLLSLILGAGVVFVICRQFISFNNGNIVLIENKYPPNLYYLSYGVMWVALIYFLLYNHILHVPRFMGNFFSYLSRHSYSYYFIHILLMFGLNKVKTVYDPGLTLATIGLITTTVVLIKCLHIARETPLFKNINVFRH